MNIEVQYVEAEKAFYVCFDDGDNEIINNPRDPEISAWCKKNFKDKDWSDNIVDYNSFWTSSDRDVMMFSLRWS